MIIDLILAPVISKERFTQCSSSEWENVRKGGKHKNKGSENWAERAFDEWRDWQGLSNEKSIGDLSEESDIKGFINMLTGFILGDNI